MEPTLSTAPSATAAKADLGRRFAAYILDVLVVIALTFVFAFMGTRMGGLGTLIGAAYILSRDGLPLGFANGRSVGKQLMNLRPVRLDGRPMDLETSVRRNWPLALGAVLSGVGALLGGPIGALLGGIIGMIAGLLGLVEAILVLTDAEGRRIGDKFAETKVVDDRA